MGDFITSKTTISDSHTLYFFFIPGIRLAAQLQMLSPVREIVCDVYVAASDFRAELEIQATSGPAIPNILVSGKYFRMQPIAH